jgi:hypothetical protein
MEKNKLIRKILLLKMMIEHLILAKCIKSIIQIPEINNRNQMISLNQITNFNMDIKMISLCLKRMIK